MSASRTIGPGTKRNWREQLDEIRSSEAKAESGPDQLERARIQLKKWRIIHKSLRDNPFQVSLTLPRDEQWDRVRIHVLKVYDEPEITEWVGLQAQVAANIRDGIRDLRPRKNGPCYDLLLEYVRDRKRKANAVLKWAREAKKGHSLPPDGPSANRLTELYRIK